MASPYETPGRHRANSRRSNGKGNNRPVHLRTQSEALGEEDALDLAHPLTLTRHKSTATPAKLARLSDGISPLLRFNPVLSHDENGPPSPRSIILEQQASAGAEIERVDSMSEGHAQATIHFDFTKIDYELKRARKLGSGLWSNVFLSEPTLPPVPGARLPSLKPSISVFAVKIAARRDAGPVFYHEAKMLSHLQDFAGASQHIVHFYGIDSRNDALIFEAVVGGSLEDLVNRLGHMTDFARHQEVVSIFPSIAMDLISGLEFMHTAGVVHADIKPQNVLLDVSDHYSLPAPVIRARYIDFSAAFMPSTEDEMLAGGGTWDYMAPEQMRIQKELSTPTFASDVWSLGISLLSIIVLGSPYTAACGQNRFMLREAIKSGDVLGFAKSGPKIKERMDACQDFIDCCKLALQKDRDRRITASAWKIWLEDQQA